jgi:hypothetical protein
MPFLPSHGQPVSLRRSSCREQPTRIRQTGPQEREPAEGRSHRHHKGRRVVQIPGRDRSWRITRDRLLDEQPPIGEHHPACGKPAVGIQVEPATCQHGFAGPQPGCGPTSQAAVWKPGRRVDCGHFGRNPLAWDGNPRVSGGARPGRRALSNAPVRGPDQNPAPFACGRLAQLLPFSRTASAAAFLNAENRESRTGWRAVRNAIVELQKIRRKHSCSPQNPRDCHFCHEYVCGHEPACPLSHGVSSVRQFLPPAARNVHCYACQRCVVPCLPACTPPCPPLADDHPLEMRVSRPMSRATAPVSPDGFGHPMLSLLLRPSSLRFRPTRRLAAGVRS